MRRLLGSPDAPVELPFVFEIKAAGDGAAGPTLEQIREACDKLEEKFEAQK